MKFKDNQGNIYETENKFVIEQMKKSNAYVKVGDKVDIKPQEPTVAELKTKLDELGIEYANNATKAQLMTLLAKEEE